MLSLECREAALPPGRSCASAQHRAWLVLGHGLSVRPLPRPESPLFRLWEGTTAGQGHANHLLCAVTLLSPGGVG